MRKLEGRSLICILLIVAMLAGLIYFVVRLEMNGGDWAGYYANTHVFKNGNLNAGEVRDRNGNILLKYTADGPVFAETERERRACSHLTGDIGFNITTGANVAFRSRLIGYNFLTGTDGIFGNKGATVSLSIDKDLNVTAYKALGKHTGFVCVYNYRTGDIVCLVSTPTVDPANADAASTAKSGAFINKVLSSTFAPGSTFKVLTAAAAIENIDDLESWTFTCDGSHDLGGSLITCPKKHGTMDFYGALANSCNCAFGQLACDLGTRTMEKYVSGMGLTSSYDINGIKTSEGSFNFDSDPVNIGWAGIGQFEDEVNPMSMLIFMGSIAGGGSTAEPSLIKGGSSGSVSLMDSSTAEELDSMLRNDVLATYGDDNFPGLELRAKSGSAETGEGKNTNAWFYGYTGDYAFIVMAENSGAGATVAGPIANTVLQKLKDQEMN